LECVVHASDISFSTRNKDVANIWRELLFEEFFSQGDKEVKLNSEQEEPTPITFLCDRLTVNIPKS